MKQLKSGRSIPSLPQCTSAPPHPPALPSFLPPNTTKTYTPRRCGHRVVVNFNTPSYFVSTKKEYPLGTNAHTGGGAQKHPLSGPRPTQRPPEFHHNTNMVRHYTPRTRNEVSPTHLRPPKETTPRIHTDCLYVACPPANSERSTSTHQRSSTFAFAMTPANSVTVA